jgi:hypothetical protein
MTIVGDCIMPSVYVDERLLASNNWASLGQTYSTDLSMLDSNGPVGIHGGLCDSPAEHFPAIFTLRPYSLYCRLTATNHP